MLVDQDGHSKMSLKEHKEKVRVKNENAAHRKQKWENKHQVISKW